MFIFTFLLTFLILSRGKIRRSNDILGNDGDQFSIVSQETYHLSNYDITFWIRHLQVEHYAFLENKESFYTVFVELHDSPFIMKIIDSYYMIKLFFELYNCSIFDFENLCSLELRKFRKFNCIYRQGTACANTNARTYQEWCNIPLLNIETPVCNCYMTIDDQQLQRPQGFSSYFKDLLPKSFCTPGDIYKIIRCFTIMINDIRTTRCDVKCHQKQPFCKDIGLWTFMMPVLTSNSFFWLPPIYNNTCGKGLVSIVSLCYNQIIEKKTVNYIDPELLCCPISFMKYICKLASSIDVATIIRFTESYLPIDDYFQKDICIHVLKEEINDDNQKSNKAYYNNDFKEEIPLVKPKYMKSMRSLRRHLLQNIDHGYGYGNTDYSAQGGKFAYRGYARYKDSIMNENKDEDDDDDNDDDEEDEDYEISDEPAPEDEIDNAEEEEEDDEFGHQSIGPKARLASFNRVVFPYVSKKQKQHLRKENVRVRSVTVTEECDEEEPTEALQYYDYGEGT
ncbi:DNA polymerase epsilon subunit 2-like isoform X1 [Vespula maculifrons]|uniref:DNA polymerase epsilon subunit 2-like isoform X1 n=1 Tax=Vespula maculifrons TaxID=7453 RepID=A0ABD2B9S8_VESMC